MKAMRFRALGRRATDRSHGGEIQRRATDRDAAAGAETSLAIKKAPPPQPSIRSVAIIAAGAGIAIGVLAVLLVMVLRH
jgi:hypothetical protein